MDNKDRPAKKKMSNYGFEISIPNNLENLQLPDPSLLQLYQGLEERIYWLLGPVDDCLYDLVQYIVAWNREDENADLEIKDRKPIRIVIASEGGSLDVQKTVTSFIELSKTPVIGIAIGMVASAASMIYLSCHKRLATSNCTFVFHRGSASDISGTYQQIAAFMENYAKDIANMFEFYKSHTNYDPELIENKLDSGDWYIDADEAVENGIVHEIMNDFSILI